MVLAVNYKVEPGRSSELPACCWFDVMSLLLGTPKNKAVQEHQRTTFDQALACLLAAGCSAQTKEWGSTRNTKEQGSIVCPWSQNIYRSECRCSWCKNSLLQLPAPTKEKKVSAGRAGAKTHEQKKVSAGAAGEKNCSASPRTKEQKNVSAGHCKGKKKWHNWDINCYTPRPFRRTNIKSSLQASF